MAIIQRWRRARGLVWAIIASSFLLPQAALAQIAEPTEVSGLVFWVDAQDVNADGSEPSDGAPIATWIDKSGQGNNVTTAAGTATYEKTGFDGVNPGIRFPLGARMAGPNPFGTAFHNQMSVFLVNANVTLTTNFAFTLNGLNNSGSAADGRFSINTPWALNNTVFFDAGSCCGTARLSNIFPNAPTETTLYSGINDEPGNRQLLRLDGLPFDSDNTGHNANVTRGIHIGDFSVTEGNGYNGRFAEILVYNRALNQAEIEAVECYLLAKWKPSAAPAGCVPDVTVTKLSEVWAGSAGNIFAIPGNDILYSITVEKAGGASLTDDSILAIDSLPGDVVFFNGDLDDAGPETNAISFQQNGSGLDFVFSRDIRFSSDTAAPTSFSQCTYAPAPGYDPLVRHICLNPKGTLPGSALSQSFTVRFRARLE